MGIKKLAAIRRQEKEDDKKAKARVLAQIEADKAARKAERGRPRGRRPNLLLLRPLHLLLRLRPRRIIRRPGFRSAFLLEPLWCRLLVSRSLCRRYASMCK